MDVWDYLAAASIGLLVFFTPFAASAGEINVWATGASEGISFLLVLLWVAKSLVTAHRRGFSPLLHGEFRTLTLGISAFLALLLFQIVPLPPQMIRALSSDSYELYRTSLPGWPNRLVYNNPGYVHPAAPHKSSSVVTVLPTVEEVRNGAAVPFTPGAAGAIAQEDETQIAPTAWRSLSVTPVLTRAGLIKCLAYAALLLTVVFYQAGASDPRSERQFRRVLLLIILASGVAVAMAGLSQQAFAFGRNVLGASAGGQRASGPFYNPDHFANYLAMILPLEVAGAVFRVPLERTEGFSGFQFLCAGVALILAAAIVLSLSRAGWIEIGLGAFVIAYVLRSLRRHHTKDQKNLSDPTPAAGTRDKAWILPLALGLIAVAIVSLFLVGPGGREQAGARVADSLLGGVGFWDRIHTWTDSVKMVRDYPIFGSGLGSWTTLFPRYQRAPWTEYFVNAAENDYLETAAECGIVGLALLGWLWWKIGRYLSDGSRSIPSRHWPLLAALLAAIVIMAFHESLDFCMQIPANAIMFVLLLGMAIRLVRTHASAISSRPAKVMDFAAPIVIALTAIAGLVGIRYQREVLYPDDLPQPASIQDNEAVILSHPASPIPHLWLADRVYNSSGVWLTPELESAIWLDPNNPAGRDRYVQALLSQGRKAEALQELTTAMYLAPTLNNHSYLDIRLLSWMPKDERAAIERGLREASASGFQGASDGLAQFYLAEGRPFEAANIYAAAAQHDKATRREFDYKLAAGVTYAQAGESAQAEKFLLAALHLKRDDPRPYRDLIQMVYGPERDAAAAATIIRMAANNNVSKAPLYSALEDAAQRAGDTGLTETALREAANSDPTFSNWMRLGSFYLEQGNYIRVRNTIRRALQINPQSGEAYFVLAQAEEGTYQYSAARTDYQRAAALSPDHPEFKARSLNLDRKIAEDAPSR